MHYSSAARSRSASLRWRVAALALAALALEPELAHRAGARRRSRRRVAVDGEPRRLLHLRRGRALGRQHQRKLVEDRRARLDRLRRQRDGHGRTDRRLPPLEVGRGLHRRRRQRREPRLLRRQDLDASPRRQHFKPGLDFYNSGGQRRPGADAAALRRDAQRQARRGLDRRQQLQLRRHRADCIEDFLLSPSWWPNYCNDDSSVTSNFTSSNVADAEDRDQDRDPERRAGDDATPATRARSTRSSCRTTRRRSRTARASATRRAATRGSRPAAAASGTTTPTTPTRRCCRRSTAPCSARRGATGLANVKTMELARRSTAGGCARTPSGCSRRRACPPGRTPGAVDKTEWINQVRTVTTIFGPYEIQEDIHPNYWGAARAAQLPDAGLQRRGAEGRHVHDLGATGLNAAGEPNMSLH